MMLLSVTVAGYHVAVVSYRSITILAGYRSCWLPLLLVTVVAGYRCCWLPLLLVTVAAGYHCRLPLPDTVVYYCQLLLLSLPAIVACYCCQYRCLLRYLICTNSLIQKK